MILCAAFHGSPNFYLALFVALIAIDHLASYFSWEASREQRPVARSKAISRHLRQLQPKIQSSGETKLHAYLQTGKPRSIFQTANQFDSSVLYRLVSSHFSH